MLNLNANPLDWLNIHPAILPVDSNGGAMTGLAVSMKGYEGCLVVIQKKAGVAGDDPAISLLQGTSVAFGTNKALQIDTVRQKLHATTVPGLFTEVTQSAADSYTDLTSAEKAGIIAIDVKAEDLDVDNGYDCIRLDIADTGSAGAQLLSASYILYGPKYGGGGVMLSPIAD